MIEIKDEILAGIPKYRITDSNGNIIADNATIEMITQILQAGTPMNKAMFELFENDYTAQINDKIELSNIYNLLALTTEKKTITENFTEPSEWKEESTLKVEHPYSGFTIFTTKVYNENTNAMKKFVDGDDNTLAINGTYYMAIQRPYAWNLKQIRGKIRSETSSSTYRPIRIGTENSLSTAGTYQSYTNDVIITDTFDFGITTERTEFYFRSRNGSTNYDLRAYELYSITYESLCNVLNYSYNHEIANGTVIKFKTPSDINEILPTVLKIGSSEINLGMRKPNTNYEIIYNDPTSLRASLPISIKTGTISNNGVIPQTDGYTKYLYFVSPCNGGTSYSINTSAGSIYTVSTAITCSVDQLTRKVSCTMSGSNCSANYIEIAWR